MIHLLALVPEKNAHGGVPFPVILIIVFVAVAVFGGFKKGPRR